MPIDKQEVQNFIQKIWKMVNAPATDNLIHWNKESGKSFVITNQTEFAKHVLPLYFKHQNMPSFIRQLNMYGFRKVMNVDHMGLATTNEEIEFMHNDFQKNAQDKLKSIKRKMPNKSEITASLKLGDVEDIYQEIESIKQKQSDFNDFLNQLRSQNQILWSEIRMERQKHEHQREMLNKMFGFLVSIVKNKKVVFDQGVKRKAPMILDTDNSPTKIAKNSTQNENFQSTSPEMPQIFEICEETGANSILPLESQISQTFNNIITDDQQALQLQAPVQQLPMPNLEDNNNFETSSQQKLQQEQQEQSTQDLLNLAMEELEKVDQELGDNANENNPQASFNISNPITDLVLSNPPNNLAVIQNYQEIQDHIDGIDMELDWLGDQIRSFSEYDYDSNLLNDFYKYDDLHQQSEQYQLDDVVADNSLEPGLQTPPNPVDSSNETNNDAALFPDLK